MVRFIDFKIYNFFFQFSFSCKEEAEGYKPLIAYVKGKAINCYDAYSTEAEELLTMAVKLDPLNYKAWTSLGQCYWKKGDKMQAKDCVKESIMQNKNKEALCELSIILRQLQDGSSPDSNTQLIEESVLMAKQAIEIDLADHKSWYIYGNALCARFFGVSFDVKDLQKSLHAYNRSESLGGTCNPDLYFNKGSVLRYLQDFSGAKVCFRKAQEIDPHLSDSSVLIQEMRDFLIKVNELIMNTGKQRKKKLEDLRHQLVSSPLASGTTTLSALSLGSSSNVNLALKVLMPVSKGSAPPCCFLCLDVSGSLAVLAVYNIGLNVSHFTPSQVLTVSNFNVIELKESNADFTSAATEPNARSETSKLQTTNTNSNNDVMATTQLPAVLCVQVFDISSLRVDGSLIDRASVAAPMLKIEAFDA